MSAPMRILVALAAIAAGGGAARGDCPDRFDFVVIADDTGELTLTDPAFVRGRAIPSLGPDGRVAFTSWLDAGGRAVMVGDENVLVERVRDREADPDSDWTFLDTSLLSGDIAFFTGMLERPGPVLPQSWPALGAASNAPVVDEIAVGEPGQRFSSFGTIDVTSDGLVAVGAYDEELGGQVIATARFLQGLRVIESGEPGGYGAVSIGQGDEVSYFSNVASGQRLVSASGALVAETDPDTGLGPQPPISMGPGTAIAYMHLQADPAMPGRSGTQIRRWNPSTLSSSTLADTAAGDFSLHADGIKVSLLDQTGLAGDGSDNRGWGGCVVFLGQGDEGRDTIYIADDDGIGVVVQEGVEIDGGVVGILDMGPMAVYATGQIAFWARLSGRDAIVRADPATGPGGGGSDDDDDGDGSDGTDDGGDDGDGSDDGSDDSDGTDGGGEGGCLSVAGRASPSWSSVVFFALVAFCARCSWQAPSPSGQGIDQGKAMVIASIDRND